MQSNDDAADGTRKPLRPITAAAVGGLRWPLHPGVAILSPAWQGAPGATDEGWAICCTADCSASLQRCPITGAQAAMELHSSRRQQQRDVVYFVTAKCRTEACLAAGGMMGDSETLTNFGAGLHQSTAAVCRFQHVARTRRNTAVATSTASQELIMYGRAKLCAAG